MLLVWNSNLPRYLLILCIKFDNATHRDDEGKPGDSAERKGRTSVMSYVEAKDAAHKGPILRVPVNVQTQMSVHPTLKIQFEAMLGKIKYS